MMRLLALLLAIGMAAAGSGAAAQAKEPPLLAAEGTLQVAFSPWDDTQALILRAIEGAKRQVLVQAFSFTSRDIALALIAARARGVDVRVLADREQTFAGESSRIPDLAAAGIPVWLEVRYQAAHNKVMVIDAGGAAPTVITGSYNWTAAASRKNAENVLLLRGNRPLALAYAKNWRRHRADALPYAESGGR
jgi:phosphatidylserine/phosphatidylglycerophosphate/cardiolipin synthase-like enzyme